EDNSLTWEIHQTNIVYQLSKSLLPVYKSPEFHQVSSEEFSFLLPTSRLDNQNTIGILKFFSPDDPCTDWMFFDYFT
ncbi:hypothetical protein VP01_6950g1, partial [Puccinia sorghi]